MKTEATNINGAKKTNYHTHTKRCKHAGGEDREYVLAAIEAGFSILGFADHGPLPFKDGFVSPVRMDTGMLPQYFDSIQKLKEEFKGQITLYQGLEYEYFPEFLPYIKSLLEEGTLEYAILGNHFALDERGSGHYGNCRSIDQVKSYVTNTIKGLETGLFAYLAHPDLFLQSYPVFDKEVKEESRRLCKAAADRDIPIEYNLLGLEKQRNGVPGLGYPYLGFWEIAAAQGCKAIIGVDAHKPKDLLTSDYAVGEGLLKTLGIREVKVLKIG